MKILFFSEQSPHARTRTGGAENSMRLMAEGLAARGHDVTFAALRADMRPLPWRLSVNGVAVLLAPTPRKSFAQRVLRRLGRTQGGLARRLRAQGWDRVARLLFEGARYDIVYAFYELDFLERALAARKAAPGMKIVMRMAGLGWRDSLKRDPGLAPALARAFNGVDAINYLSARSRAQIETEAAAAGLALAPGSAFVADIGVDVDRVPRLWAAPTAAPGLEIVTATRFSPTQKRQDILVEALGLLKDRLPFRATLIGTGATRDAIAARCRALGLTERIEILPFLAQEDLWARLRHADLLCHPCDHEGVSKIILEAMMVGLPVLASDVDPLPDYVIEGETGYRVANTPEAWADRLMAIAADKAALPALSLRARAFVEAQYAMAPNLDRYEAEFAALASA